MPGTPAACFHTGVILRDGEIARVDVASARRLEPIAGSSLDGTRQVLAFDGEPVVLLRGQHVQADLLAATAKAAGGARLFVLVEEPIPPVAGTTVLVVDFYEHPIPGALVVVADGLVRATGYMGGNGDSVASLSLPRCVSSLLAEL